MKALTIKRYKNPGDRRTMRVRSKVKKNLEMPRLLVFRSNKYVYAQIVDNKTGKTLMTVRDAKAEQTGKDVAEKAKKMDLSRVVFDRGAYRYHGRVKRLAEAAREGGLKF